MASSDSSSALGFPAAGASSGASDPKSLEVSSTEDEHAMLDCRGRVMTQTTCTRLPMMSISSPGRTTPPGYGPQTGAAQKRTSSQHSRGSSIGSIDRPRAVHFLEGRPPRRPPQVVDDVATIEPDTKRQNSALTSPSTTPMTSWEAIPISGQQPSGSQGSGTNSLPATVLAPGPVAAAVLGIEDAVRSAMQPSIPVPGIDLTTLRFVMPSSCAAAALPHVENGVVQSQSGPPLARRVAKLAGLGC